MRCVNCDCELHKKDMVCPGCHTDDLIKKGLFWYKFLGFIIGLFIPTLINMILVLFFSDRRVKTDFLNAGILGRSKWRAARIGIIIGFVIRFIILLFVIVTIILFTTQRYFEILNLV